MSLPRLHKALRLTAAKCFGFGSDCVLLFDSQSYWGSLGLRQLLSGQASGQMLTSWFRSGRRGLTHPDGEGKACGR